MRQRTTWTNRSAATEDGSGKDIYDMNVEHPQPGATDYESGDPSTWAEDVNSGKSIESEYQGGAVKRDEIGMPQMRDDTFSHRGTKPWGSGGSYDNQRLAAQKAAERKAMGCERIARALLRTNDEKHLEPVMTHLMALPTQSIAATLKRMDHLSPAALPKEARFRRALACTKLSALLLSEEAKEGAIERLATVFANMDNPTLKSILKIVATERVVVAEEKEEDDDKPAFLKDKEEEKEEEEVKTSAEKEEGKEEAEEGKEEAAEAKEGDGILEDADLDNLRQMMVEVEKAEAEGSLDDMGEGGGAPMPPAGGLDISFDEEMETPEAAASVMASNNELAGLFETDESLAQQEIAKAEGGFAPVAAGRTASTGARKLGAVRAASGSGDDLNVLWDKPEGN